MPRASKVTNGIVPYSPQQTAVIQSIFDSIPRAEIIQALLDSGDQRAVSLAERLSDGQFDRLKLAKHCFDLKLLPKDVWQILIETRKTEARLQVSEGLRSIAAAVIEAAIPQVIQCPRCKGKKKNPPRKKGDDWSDCTMCQGLGEILKPADRESQKMALEMGEMLNIKVPLVAQQFNSYSGQKSGTYSEPVPDMADWSRSTDSVFEEHRSTTVVDAETVGE